ncbi:MAG: SGNH/GDSL hydrolase family protein [Alphaproteobacteria bacterium]|nr:SGNH/GDSL hydrolase family protein [Alphaproteobacteria bacterium]
MRIRHFALSLGLILAAVSGARSAPIPKETWIGAWGFVPIPLPPGITPAAPVTAPVAVPLSAAQPTQPVATPPGPPLLENPGNLAVVNPEADPSNITIRELVRVSVAGKRLRIRISNEGGSDALVLGAVHVGAAGPDGTVLPGSDHAVTFDGRSSVVVPAGAPLLSDAVDLKTEALEKLVISIHVPGTMSRVGHSLYQYVAGQSGDHTATASLPGARIMRLPALVTQVEVDPVSADSVVVTFGDSITEGAASTNNAFRGWPDRLAERLAAAKSKYSVVNAGIGGNRLLRYGTGPGALARLDRDVFGVAGVKAVILLEGINDIGRGFTPTGPQDPATLEALIAADKQFIARCHAHGIKVYGALLTPYQGAGYASPAGEAVRSGLNNWIKTSGAFDGVVDFATPTGDPANPLTFRSDYNLRDKLHPNDAGYEAMGKAIDLGLFK